MKSLYFIIVVFFFSCSQKVANYKATSHGYVVWRYTKKGEPKKEILSTGDTLLTDTKKGIMCFLNKGTSDTIWILKPSNK